MTTAQLYRHFKGGFYSLFYIGYCSDEGEFYAVYKRSDHPSDATWGCCRHGKTEQTCYVTKDGRIYVNILTDLAGYSCQELRMDAIEQGLWIRPVEMFYECEEIGGKHVKRFQRIES